MSVIDRVRALAKERLAGRPLQLDDFLAQLEQPLDTPSRFHRRLQSEVIDARADRGSEQRRAARDARLLELIDEWADAHRGTPVLPRATAADKLRELAKDRLALRPRQLEAFLHELDSPPATASVVGSLGFRAEMCESSASPLERVLVGAERIDQRLVAMIDDWAAKNPVDPVAPLPPIKAAQAHTDDPPPLLQPPAGVAYWQAVLIQHILRIDQHRRATTREAVDYLRALYDQRIGQGRTIGTLTWRTDSGAVKRIEAKTIANALSRARAFASQQSGRIPP